VDIKNNRLIKPIHIYLAIYFLVNLLFLDTFPKMHSDEAWLSGLARSYMNTGVDSTEYFFDLLPRSPHAIKIIFHSMQVLFISLFGYSLFSMRLLSLIFSIACLYVFNKIAKILFEGDRKLSLGLTVLLSIDIQYIYASHFARQEIEVLFFMLMAFYYLISMQEHKSINDIVLGGIVGLSVGFHPNSFIVALLIGAVYLYKIIFEKKLKFHNLIRLMIVVGLFGCIFVGISLYFNSNFVSDYGEFGATVGADRTVIERITYIADYYKMLFKFDSVTYYMPKVRGQLILFGFGFIVSIAMLILKKAKNKTIILLIALMAINIGYIVIGRYSQPSIIFIFPFCYLIIFMMLPNNKKLLYFAIVIAFIGLVINTGVELKSETNSEYNDYLSDIEEHIPKSAKTLANLNVEYAKDYNCLYEIRNLAFLNSGEFDDYIFDRSIEYIVFAQEMEFIYENRPVWNVVYGNIYPYYDDMIEFMDDRCELIYTGKSDYAMRILYLADKSDWEYRIYKVIK